MAAGSEDVPEAWDEEIGTEDTTDTGAEAHVENGVGADGRAGATVDAKTPANGHVGASSHDDGALAEASESDSESDDDSVEDSKDPSKRYISRVRTSYGRLQSRRVDLVGDYAGNELFLLDGDSLLLRCFSDERLDFDSGFQLLHAVYNVEHALQQLSRRKCNFHVVFFTTSKNLCVPPNAQADEVKYLLARAAIIQHLRAHLPSTHPDIQVVQFASYTSPEFAEYLTLHAPYFIMAHDGASGAYRKGKHMAKEEVATPQLNPNRLAWREMILFYVESGYNVALLNGLEWRDTKIMTLVLERRKREKSLLDSRGSLLPPVGEDISDEIAGVLAKAWATAPHLTQRQILATAVLGTLLGQLSNDASSPQYLSLARSFLEHMAALNHLPLSARRLPQHQAGPDSTNFLVEISRVAASTLCCAAWRETIQDSASPCNLADFIDGRLFQHINSSRLDLPEPMQETFTELAGLVQHLCGVDLINPERTVTEQTTSNGMHEPSGESDTSKNLAVMPFSNSVFDPHLANVRLAVDEQAAQRPSAASHKIFREVTHWHNAKKPIVQKGPPAAQSDKQAFWAAKRNQIFMAEMQKYAASLTNAVGRSLEPETIIVSKDKPKQSIPQQQNSGRETPDSESSGRSSAQKQGLQKKAGGKKGQQQAAGKQALLDQMAATKAKKDEAATDKAMSAWRTWCKNNDIGDDPRLKFNKAKAHLATLSPESPAVPECQLYMMSCLLQRWIALCKIDAKDKHLELAALIWSMCGNIRDCGHLTKEIDSGVDLTLKTLDLPPVQKTTMISAIQSRALPFKFALPTTTTSLSVGMPSKEFQLKYCGPYLERSFDSAPDSRVDFDPDGWQRQVLDTIDANKSVFAVAPTSAGKTFISFYAMKKVLEADDDGVLVYVAPTKALVNQIAAEIQARYSKKFKYGGKSVWAIHTRDYRINNPTGCQVLVTVPHVLQIMLLAPSNAHSWSTRVKRIIFDEIHSIGQAEDGVVWEQLLLLAPCPIIALSATVGNVSEFSQWLETTQHAIGYDLVTVQHPHRYSDLRKYVYTPPKQFAFSGLPEKTAFGTLGIEQAVGLNRMHPVAGLIDKSRGMPDDFSLEPTDCLELYRAMRKHATDQYPVPENLDPATVLPKLCRKVDVLRWERQLKDLLHTWMSKPGSPYDALLHDLEESFRDKDREAVQRTHASSQQGMNIGSASDGHDDLQTWTLSLLCRLHQQDALPAILFNYDRHDCERITRAVVDQLVAAEHQQVKSGPAWARKLEKFEEWKKIQEKSASKAAKKTTKKASDKEDGEKSSKLDLQREAAGAETSSWETFDPDAPVEGYTFADYSKVLASEMDIYIRQLRRREVQPWLIDSLKRGIGIHHAGMNRKYRQIVEILFRKRFLRVVVATGTLALGINMPCKTVVFSGDSVFLTALNYRQCAGRAGRRGFDLLGNVVFQGISTEKICRLISSRLPDLNGHFPITTTLVLRLFTLLDESKNSKFASSSINAMLSQPRLFLGSEAFKDQVMHHLRFSIEYLRRQYLLSSTGSPLNFAGLVSHLYFTENSSFAFHALLKEGYFHELCASITRNEKDTLETMMLVLAHIFNRVPCRQSDEEYKEKVVKPSSSIVFLPPLPEKAANILRSHNQQTLDVYRTYVETFVEQHAKSTDNKLPLTKVQGGADAEVNGGVPSLSPPTARSSFVALSGHGDDFTSISDLCETTREGVFLEEAVIPYVGIHPDETTQPLNAWLLDFFKHGDVHTIERANGIRRSDIWFMLNDFSMVLATIIASLMGFMKLKNVSDMDTLDITGQGDAHEEAQDDTAAAEDQSDVQSVSVADSAISMPERPKPGMKKKAKNVESWEELADEEEAAAGAEMEADVELQAEDGWNPEEEGLRKVLQAFTKLHAEFNVKFRAMWA